MSAISLADRSVWPQRLRFDTLFGAVPVYAATGVAMLLLLLPTGFAALVDARLVEGVNVWAKPLKFQVSLAAFLLTLAFLARYVRPAMLAAGGYRVFSYAVAAAVALEIAWIMGAAAMGVASHFNRSAIGQVIYPLMGAVATLLTSATAVQAWQIARSGDTRLSPVLRDGIVIGLALVLPLTLITSGTLASGSGHLVGQGGGATIPLLGWARDAGDLRVAHFFATHAMHAVPAFAIGWAILGDSARRLPVWLFAVAYSGFTLAVLFQAMAGRPFLPL
jgi:hypothetical protein